jgi:hypothetical protein
MLLLQYWDVPEKIHTPPTEEISGVRRERGEKIIVTVLGHPKVVGGFTSNFLCGGGMDVFWNDPLIHLFFKAHTHVYNDKIIK